MNIRMVMTRPEWRKPDIRAAIAEGLGLGLRAMHRERMPIKFTEAGYRTYKLAQRNKGYEARKRKEKGHNKPNVWSGAGMRAILGNIAIKALKGRGEASGRMHARFLNFSGGLGWHYQNEFWPTAPASSGFKRKVKKRNFHRFPDHKGEMEKQNKTDEKLVAKVSEAHVGVFFNSKGRTKTVKT